MSRKASTVIALLALAVLSRTAATSAQGVEAIREAIDVCYRQEYDRAWSLVEPVRSADTTDPAPVYWQAALVQLLAYDTGDPALVDSFHRLSDKAEALCQLRLRKSKSDTSAYFYLGMTRLNRANSFAWEQKRTAAARTMLKVTTPLRTALKLEPGLADAHFGLGMVEYFRAVGDAYLLGLGILGSKKRAFEWVERAVADSGLFQPSAWFSLAWMLGQSQHYDEALKECDRLLVRYPGNRTVIRTMRDICYDKGDYAEVLAIGREMEQSILASFPENKYYLSENWLKTAKAWDRLGRADSALALTGRIIDWEQHQDQVPWLKNYVREAKELRSRLMR